MVVFGNEILEGCMRKILKIVLITAALVLVLAVAFISSLPTLMSTKWGQNLTLGSVNSKISGRIQVENLNLSWLGKQEIQGFTLFDAEDEPAISLESLQIDLGLISLLKQGLSPVPAEIKGLNATLIQDEAGTTNIQTALSPKKSSLKRKANKDHSQLYFRDVNGSIKTNEFSNLFQAKLSGKTLKGSLDGYFDIEGAVPSNLAQPQNVGSDINMSIRVVNFPVDFLDQIVTVQAAKYKGLVRAALGSYVNITIEETQKGSTATTYWDIQSPNLNFSFNGIADQHQFSLDKPAKAEFKLTSELISRLTEENDEKTTLSLNEPSTLVVWFHDFAIPWYAALDSRYRREMSLNLEFDLSKISIIGGSLKKAFLMNGIHGEIKAQKGSESAVVRVKGKTVEGDIKIDVMMDKPKSFNSLLESIKKRAKIQIDFSEIPLVIVDQIMHTGTFYSSLLGNSLKMNAFAEIENGEGNGSLFFESDNINLPRSTFSFTSTDFTLDTPSTLTYTITPSFVNDYVLNTFPLNLSGDAQFQLLINTLKASWKDFKFLSNDLLLIDAEVSSLNEINLEGDGIFGSVSIESAKLLLNGQSLKSIDTEFFADLTSNTSSGVFAEILGSESQVDLSAVVDLNNLNSPDLKKIKLEIGGSGLKAIFSGVYVDKMLSLTSPASIELFLTSQALTEYLPKSNFTILDKKNLSPPKIKFTVAPPSNPWVIGNPAGLNILGNISIDPIAFNYGSGEIELRDFIAPWEVSGKENKVKVSFSGKTYSAMIDKSGTFRGKYILKDFLEKDTFSLSDANLKLKASIVDFPTEFLNFSGESPDLQVLFGNTLNADVDLQMAIGNSSGDFDFTFYGDEIHCEAGMVFDEFLTLKNPNKPATLTMSLTPERFLLLDKHMHQDGHNQFTLRSSTNATCTISQLKLPWLSDFSYWNSSISAAFTVGRLAIFDKVRGYEVPFQKIDGKIDSDNLAERIHLTLKTLPDQTSTKSGSLDFDCLISDAFTKNGDLNFDALSLDLHGIASQLDTGAFCHLFCPFPTMPDKIRALVGNSIEADIKALVEKMEGPIKVNLKGTEGKLHLEGQLAAGILTLDAPFVAEVTATPALGRYILHDVAPFLSTLRSGDRKIQLVISEKGFTFPVADFNKKKIKIDLCTITTGQMLFENSGQIKAILGLLSGNGLKDIPIWMTPLYIRVLDGRIHLERMDMLLMERYPVAAWGDVDIEKEKVNMIIGVTGTALKNAMKLEELDSNYMLQIPFKGALDNPKLDKKKAIAKISSLIAKRKGTQGAVIGTFLDIASGGKDNKVPAPTTQPLPWEVKK